MESKGIVAWIKSQYNAKNVEGMARFGISSKNTYGVSIPLLRGMGKKIGKDHKLAQELWASGIHEARILAALIDDPKQVTEKQMESWVKDFESWDVCDQVCMNLFDKTEFAWKNVREWSNRDEEFVKRAAFALIASLASHDKKASDAEFEKLLPLIRGASTDERNFVKKAVNWALRGIGKRNLALNKKAIACAKEIQKIDSKAARWNAADALRELQSEAVQARLRKRK
jgi:3-methyladenine DNA glycosylase AlkD